MNAPDVSVAANNRDSLMNTYSAEVEARVIAWRRDIHANPELGNREFRTAALVAAHLRALGFDEVREKVAHTGVVGVLKGHTAGPCVALRADMDALPVTEETDVPFKSTVRSEWNGVPCGVMHACGHDAHVAILMGVAEVLSRLRAHIRGTVKFIFQPAEEMPPQGEDGGAKMMIAEGCLDSPKVEAIFGLHVTNRLHIHKIGYRVGPMMASADLFRIRIRGNSSHGARPWSGVDPIVVGSQVVVGLQTIVSRRMNITEEPSVVTVGSFHSGNRGNIIPDEAHMEGTIRTFDEGQRADIHEFIQKITKLIAESGGATGHVHIEHGYPVTVNHPQLTEWAVPSLQRIAGETNVEVNPKSCGAEDFAYYQKEVPGLFFNLGITPPDVDCKVAPANHSPRFFIDERGLLLGVRALAGVALDWLAAEHAPRAH